MIIYCIPIQSTKQLFLYKPITVLDYQYPFLISKFPKLIKLVYAFNYLTQLRKWYVMQEWKLMLANTQNKFTVIDIGCGEGQYIVPYCTNYPSAQFIGFDNRKSNQVFCDSLGIPNLSVFCLDIETQEPNAEADLAICIGVLQYLKHDVQALINIYSCVKPGGQFLLYVPINGMFLTKFYPFIFKKFAQYESINDRKRVYTEKEITDKINLVGFEIINKSYTYGTAGKLSHELMNSCTTIILSAHLVYKILAGVILILLIPVIFSLMVFDFYSKKSEGNGLLLQLRK